MIAIDTVVLQSPGIEFPDRAGLTTELALSIAYVVTVPPKTAPVSNVYIGTLTRTQYKLTLVRSLTSVNLY